MLSLNARGGVLNKDHHRYLLRKCSHEYFYNEMKKVNNNYRLISNIPKNGNKAPLNQLLAFLGKLKAKNLKDDAVIDDDDVKFVLNAVNRDRYKDMFDTKWKKSTKDGNSMLWTSSFVLEDRIRYDAIPIGEQGQYEVEPHTGIVWFLRKKNAEHAAALAAFNSFQEMFEPYIFKRYDDSKSSISTENKKIIVDGPLMKNQMIDGIIESNANILKEYTGVQLVYKDRIEKFMKRIFYERSIVIQSLRKIIETDSDHFTITMSAAMGDNFESGSFKDDANELLMQQYKDLFRSSVIGFLKELKNTPEGMIPLRGFADTLEIKDDIEIDDFLSLHEPKLSLLEVGKEDVKDIISDSVSSYSQVEYLLDYLAYCGFCDPHRAKVHRNLRVCHILIIFM